jgi:hypothetical protein
VLIALKRALSRNDEIDTVTGLKLGVVVFNNTCGLQLSDVSQKMPLLEKKSLANQRSVNLARGQTKNSDERGETAVAVWLTVDSLNGAMRVTLT